MHKTHPADTANAEAIARASYFTVCLLVGGHHEKLELKSLDLARKARPLFEEIKGGARRALIYAVTPDGFTHLVPDTYNPIGEINMSAQATHTAARPNGKIPAAGQEPRKKKPVARLPVPPPKGTGITPTPDAGKAAMEVTLVADTKKDGIPVGLQVQNRVPLTPEQKAKVETEAVPEKAETSARAEALHRARADEKAAKSRARIAKLKAVQSGETKKMPLTGKAAIAAIANSSKSKDKAVSKTKTKTPAKDGRKFYDWKGAEAAAKNGTLPKAPDFSAETHARFRPALAEVAKMAKAKDVAGLKKFKFDGFMGSSARSIMRYRGICIAALQAK